MATGGTMRAPWGFRGQRFTQLSVTYRITEGVGGPTVRRLVTLGWGARSTPAAPDLQQKTEFTNQC